eukprot:1822604-Alexandrium_andersonii.AAC.1
MPLQLQVQRQPGQALAEQRAAPGAAAALGGGVYLRHAPAQPAGPGAGQLRLHCRRREQPSLRGG